MTWIEELMEATKEAESPKQYMYWSALAAISAVMRKNVWVNRGGLYKLYPNIYVLLIGKSGLRKGFSIKVAKDLVEDVDVIRVISGRVSIQGLIKYLSQARTTETGKVMTSAQTFLASGEYASSIIEDPAAIYCMTDLYDTHAHTSGWTNTLALETRKLIDPYFVMLSASNETNLAATLPKISHGGGLVARTFFVHANEVGKVNDLMDAAPTLDLKPFSKYLIELSKLSGEFKITDEAKYEVFRPWYILLQEDLKSMDDPTGTLQRLHDQILKISMLISLSESSSLTIEARHLKEAMDKAQDCIPGMRKITLRGGESPLSNQISEVIRLLLKHTEITRKVLLRKGWPNFDAFDLDRISETLVQAGIIKIHKAGGQLVYKLEKEAAEEFLGGRDGSKK